MGTARHGCPHLLPKGTFPQLSVQIQAHVLELRTKHHPKALSHLSVALHGFHSLRLQNSPPATAEASDFGDGQGFSHLQVGGHTDWHLPHGEFPEGTAPELPPPTLQSPVSPDLPSPSAVRLEEPHPRLSLGLDVTVIDLWVQPAVLVERSLSPWVSRVLQV